MLHFIHVAGFCGVLDDAKVDEFQRLTLLVALHLAAYGSEEPPDLATFLACESCRTAQGSRASRASRRGAAQEEPVVP